MTDAELAEVVIRYIEQHGFSRIYELSQEDYDAAKRLAIAAEGRKT